MRKLSKKISMLMVLAMLVGLFSGVVSASAASAWSFKSSKYNVAVGDEINMKKNEYADFDLLKDGKAPEGYTVVWESSDEDVVWVNAKTGQLRANKFGKAADGDKAVISATFTNTATKKSATRSFTIVLGAAKADFTVEAADVTIALGEEVKFAPVVKDAAGNVVKFATHKSYNGYFLDGKAIANPWTPEEAGEYTVTVAQFAKKADVADLAKAVRKDEVKVTVTVDTDFDAKATGLKEITVYGDFAADAKFTVKKDSKQNVSFTATVAADGKTAKLALQNKLYEGVYTVAYGDAKVDLAIEDEKVAQIIILEKDGQIFTSIDKTEAYIHYDVLNQYGESVRKSFDVTWNSSAAGGVTPDATNGILTVKKGEAEEGEAAPTFNYNDTVVLTGVASGYGYAVSETATMSIGLEDNASTIKVLGIIKEDTTKLLDEIPASFVGGTYQLVFEMYNRAGYAMKFDADVAADDFTFTSLNPLLVKSIEGGWSGTGENKVSKIDTVYIDGKAYGAVTIVAGNADQVKGGGVAEIRVVSTKTGVSSTYNLRVVSEQILVDFKIEQPSAVVPVDGEYGGGNEIELKFEATDKEGAPITDFRALYKAVSFSPATSVELREQNDGTAKLYYMTTTETPTKQNDYPVMINAIVPGSGATSNVRFSVKYDRIASAPIQYNGAVEVLEGSQLKIFLRDHDSWNRDGGIDWADQYDVSVKVDGKFRDRVVAVKILGDAVGLTINGAYDTFGDYQLFRSSGELYLVAGKYVTEDVKEIAIEYALFDTTKGELVGGSDFVVNYKVVDLSQCVGFNVNVDDNYVQNASKTIKYSVKGTLANGNQVTIPNVIADAELGNAVISYKTQVSGYNIDATETDWTNDVPNANTGDKASYEFKPNFNIDANNGGNGNLFKDLSKFNADGSNAGRAVKVDVTATISVVAVSGTGANVELVNSFKDAVSTSYEVIGDGAYQVSVNPDNDGWVSGNFAYTNGECTEAVIKANDGKIGYMELIAGIANTTDSHKDTRYSNQDITITITNLREGTKGLAVGNLLLGSNQVKVASWDANNPADVAAKDVVMIRNAEIGDTFTATFDYQGAKHVVKFTVGADQTAKFSSASDNLTWR